MNHNLRFMLYTLAPASTHPQRPIDASHHSLGDLVIEQCEHRLIQPVCCIRPNGKLDG